MLTFRELIKLLTEIAAIITLATVVGFTFNSLSPNGLPIIRKPLRETRRFITTSELLNSTCQTEPSIKSLVSESAAAKNIQPSSQVSMISSKDNSKKSLPVYPEQEPTPRKILSPEESRIIKPTLSAQSPAHVVKPTTKVEDVQGKPKKILQALFTTLADAKACYDKKSAIFLDGRAPIDYEAEHISGAVSLFSERLDELYEQVLSSIPKDRLIVTYCSDPECTEAIKLADTLVARGHTRVVILLEGLPGWKDAGYPVATGKDPK